MGKVVSFVLLLVGVVLLAKILGPITGTALHDMAQAKRQDQSQFASVRREPSLQEFIHEEVLEAQKGLPRMKGDNLRLVSVDEGQSKMIYTFEIIGVSPSQINSSAIRDMQQEIISVFRNSSCLNNQVLPVLQLGMTVAQIYRFSETGQKAFTMDLSIRDCAPVADQTTSHSPAQKQKFEFYKVQTD